MECISYKDGYKYQLKGDYVTQISIIPDHSVKTDYIELTTTGQLTIKYGYAWDGASGPAPDIPSIMRGSLVHDALYQLMRLKQLDHDKHREPADRLLQKICLEDGMIAPMAWLVYQSVHIGGDPSADPANEKPIIKAPKSCQ